MIINNKDFKNIFDSANTNIGWTCYKIARCALRYGHWQNVAFPLLEEISKDVKL